MGDQRTFAFGGLGEHPNLYENPLLRRVPHLLTRTPELRHATVDGGGRTRRLRFSGLPASIV